MGISQLTPQQAFEILQQEPNALYVDVRSIPEFLQGHPTLAFNIPLLHKRDLLSAMQPNPDFVQVALSALPKHKKIIVGCLSGGRSQKACEILADLGYTDLANVVGGFGGGRHPQTGAPQQGWKDTGLPVATEPSAERSYEFLIQKSRS